MSQRSSPGYGGWPLAPNQQLNGPATERASNESGQQQTGSAANRISGHRASGHRASGKPALSFQEAGGWPLAAIAHLARLSQRGMRTGQTSRPTGLLWLWRGAATGGSRLYLTTFEGGLPVVPAAVVPAAVVAGAGLPVPVRLVLVPGGSLPATRVPAGGDWVGLDDLSARVQTVPQVPQRQCS
jgi:hypothetical protein